MNIWNITRHLNQYTGYLFNISIRPEYPRPSTLIAKQLLKEPKTTMEIGALRGRNSISIIKELKPKRHYIIDPLEHNKSVTNEFRKAISRHDNIMFLRGYSPETTQWTEGEQDFIYIDGNHTYEAVKKDLEISQKKISSTGIIAGHDWNNTAVSRAVVEHANSHQQYILSILIVDWILIPKTLLSQQEIELAKNGRYGKQQIFSNQTKEAKIVDEPEIE